MIDDAAVDKLDDELLDELRIYLLDVIAHSYNPWIEQLYCQILPC